MAQLTRGEFKGQQGYFTFALNTKEVNYLELSYLQALSIKHTQKINNYAVAVDKETLPMIEDKHRKVFDHIIEIPESEENQSEEWKLGHEWKAYWLTPYKETVKLDSDMIFSRNIDHWWNYYQIKDVFFCSTITNYRNEDSNVRTYRKLFDDNHLPDIYSGLMYFRYTQKAMVFFNLAREVYHNWNVVRDEVLKNCRDEYPTTDVVYSVVAKILGEEEFYIPNSPIKFCHMKGAIQNFGTNDDWTKKLYSQIDDKYHYSIGLHRQMYPVHYVQKHYAKEIIERYEQEKGND